MPKVNVRSYLYQGARSIGDLQALGRASVGGRLERRGLGALGSSGGGRAVFGAIGFIWYGKNCAGAIKNVTVRKLEKVGKLLVKDIKNSLNRKLPETLHGTKVPTNEYLPHRRIGQLRRAIKWEVDPYREELRVGIEKKEDCPYAKWLELGTTHMVARSFLRSAVARNKAQIAMILSAPVGRKTMERLSFRGMLYLTGRILGDIGALGAGKMGQRFGTRIVGRESGFGIGGLTG